MKKTAIITFHRALNYGAVLQAYGLQKALGDMGIACEVLDYRCKPMESIYKPLSLGHCTTIPGKIRKILKSGQLYRKGKNFNAFVNKYLNLSPGCDREKLEKTAADYDAVITGSDQVFNPDAVGGDFSYFLDFAKPPQKKFAYSASFGLSKLAPEYKDRITQCLREFDRISLREKTGVQIVKETARRDAVMTLDPSLLLERGNWERLAKEPKSHPDKYVLTYMMDGSDYVLQKAMACAAQMHCRVVIINPTLMQQIKHRQCKMYPSIAPDEFLWLFRHAEMVVTNSFHGLAFSLQFRKDFYVEISNREKGCRIRDLLELLNLEGRLLPCDTATPIDWNKVEEILAEQRELSKQFLRECR